MSIQQKYLNMLFYNPAAKYKKPKKEPKILTCYGEDELADLLEAIQGNLLEAPVVWGASFGLRRSECLGLRWQAVHLNKNSIDINHTMCRGRTGYISGDLVKQTSSYRALPLGPKVKEFLIRLYNRQEEMREKYKDKYAENDYICKWDDGRPIRPDYLSRNFPKFLKKNGLKAIRFHDLRHSAASNLLNAGFDIYEICDWLGHADIRSTQRYLHIEHESKRSMAEHLEGASFKKRGRVNKYIDNQVVLQK